MHLNYQNHLAFWTFSNFRNVNCYKTRRWGNGISLLVRLEECRLLGYKNQVRTLQETNYVSATEASRLLLCKMWGFHGGGYDECRLLDEINSVHTSQETHYVSATNPRRLMLCKNWGFHGGDYEECRLLLYKNPIHTSKVTQYFSATEPSQLMLYKVWGLHGGDCEECRFLYIKIQFVLRKKNITSLLQSPAS
jgi:hypothetical protein